MEPEPAVPGMKEPEPEPEPPASVLHYLEPVPEPPGTGSGTGYPASKREPNREQIVKPNCGLNQWNQIVKESKSRNEIIKRESKSRNQTGKQIKKPNRFEAERLHQ